MKELSQLFTKESPRRIIFEDFKIDLPISGGWGYDFNTACVIEKNDPSVVQGVPFDWMSIEYAFIEKRIYEEMIIFRNVKEKFAGIRWNLINQELIHNNNKNYDVLVFNVEGFQDHIFDGLLARFEEIEKNNRQELMTELDAYRESKIYRFKREFYFDITCF